MVLRSARLGFSDDCVCELLPIQFAASFPSIESLTRPLSPTSRLAVDALDRVEAAIIGWFVATVLTLIHDLSTDRQRCTPIGTVAHQPGRYVVKTV